MDLEKARQIPDFKFIIGRYLTLKPETTVRSVINSVLVQITEEIYEACQDMNIEYCYKAKKIIKRIVESTVQDFVTLFIK